MGILYVKLGRMVFDGRRSFLCQTATDPMVFYLDIDKADPSEYADWVSLVCDEIGIMWNFQSPGDVDNIIVASKTNGDGVGLHIHIPQIVSTKAILSEFAYRLGQKNKVRSTPLRGEVDRGVYNSGLRMIGCYKRNVAQGFYRIVKTGRRSMKSMESMESMEWTDIGVPTSADEWIHQIRLCSIIPSKQQACTPLNVHPQSSSCLSSSTALPPPPTSSTVILDVDIPSSTIDAARASLPDELRHAPVSSVKKMNDKCIVVVLKCKRCLNLDTSVRDGRHSNNHVYIVITPEGVYQKCHNNSDSVDGRLNGPCSSFRSRTFPLSIRAQMLLFPSLPTCEKVKKRALNMTTGRRASQSQFVRDNRQKTSHK
jgi:hypothetical protein